MNPLRAFLSYIARKRASRVHAAQARRAEIIRQQIADRRKRHKAFRYLEGEMRACVRAMLEAELVMRRNG